MFGAVKFDAGGGFGGGGHCEPADDQGFPLVPDEVVELPNPLYDALLVLKRPESYFALCSGSVRTS